MGDYKAKIIEKARIPKVIVDHSIIRTGPGFLYPISHLMVFF